MPTLPSILIADDDRLLGESLCDALAGLGAVRWFDGGRSAMAALASSPCDLLLSDVDMPDLSGFELLAWVRSQPTAGRSLPVVLMPVVLMSARADGPLHDRAAACGASALLAKPVEFPRVTALVQRLLPH